MKGFMACILHLILSGWWLGHVSCMGEGRGVYRVLVWRPEERRPLGRPIKMDLREKGIDGANWIQLAQGRV